MDAFVMSRMNKTLNWLDTMSLNNKALVLQEALKKRKVLAQIGVVDRVELARKIKQDMEEKAKEVREREQRAFQRKSNISATVQQRDGYWLSEAAMKAALDGIRTKTAQIAALKAQIKYRKEVLCQPPPRPDIYKLQPKGVKLTVERLAGILTELITASAISTSQQRILPDWEGRTVERVVKERSGAITVVEGKIDSVFERDDMHHVRIIYDDGGCEELLLDELEDEIQSGNEREARIVPHLKFGMDFDTDPTSLYSVKGIVILDQDGNRIIAKYFDKSVFGSVKEQKAFEKNLFSKTSRNSTSDIVLLDGVTCLYRSNVDLHFYVLGSSRENELILEALLTCLYDAISTVLRKQVEKKTLIDAMDTAMLIIDEICDEGIILETDSQAVVQRCNLKGDDISFSDQTFSQVGQTFIGAAREQLKWSLLK